MTTTIKCLRIVSIVSFLATAAFATAASAATLSFTGSLSQDDDVQFIDFTVGSASTVAIRSLSYAGGVNGQGTTIKSGGFDPILALFKSDGTLVAQNDDGPGAIVPTDVTTGTAFDTYFEALLASGKYFIAVLQFDSFALGPTLSDGFLRTGASFTSMFGCSNGSFCDVNGNNRTADWALDISGVQTAGGDTVPVPGSLPLFATGLGAMALAAAWRRKRNDVTRA